MIEDKLVDIVASLGDLSRSGSLGGYFPWQFADMAEHQLTENLGFSSIPGAPRQGDTRLNLILNDSHSKTHTIGSAEYLVSSIGIMNLNVVSPSAVEYPEVVGITLNANWQEDDSQGYQTWVPSDSGYVVLHDTGIVQAGLIPNGLNRMTAETLIEGHPEFPLNDFAIGLWIPDNDGSKHIID